MDDDFFDWRGDEDRWGDESPPPPPRRRRPRRDGTTWTTADGTRLAFREMDHSHLLNAIAWVERQFRQLQDTFNQDALDIDLIYPEHAGLVAEARRRRLIPRGKSQLVT